MSALPAPYLRLAELLMGARISAGLHVAIKHDLADCIADSPKSAEELAPRAGLPEESLRRLLRALTYAGVFEEHADGRFSNNAVSAFLRRDADPSLREMSLVLNHEAVLNGWRELDRVLETGEQGFGPVNGQKFFQFLAAEPERSQNMARFMKGIYGHQGSRIAAGFPFGRFRRVLDVGGGQGHILADILQAHPGVRGGVFDLARTADVAKNFIAGKGLEARCEVVSGDFFESVPGGYDAYFIKSTLHDWTDDQSVAILRNIRSAMPADGRVLITEMVLVPGTPLGHPHPFIDMEMMVTLGGKERTAAEFGELLKQAAMRMVAVHPIEGSFFAIVEGAADTAS